jgi:hypothetical protein
VTTFLGELAITALDRLLDIPDLHFSRLASGSTGVLQATLR